MGTTKSISKTKSKSSYKYKWFDLKELYLLKDNLLKKEKNEKKYKKINHKIQLKK